MHVFHVYSYTRLTDNTSIRPQQHVAHYPPSSEIRRSSFRHPSYDTCNSARWYRLYPSSFLCPDL